MRKEGLQILCIALRDYKSQRASKKNAAQKTAFFALIRCQSIKKSYRCGHNIVFLL